LIPTLTKVRPLALLGASHHPSPSRSEEMKKPSQRTIKLAAKILKSDGVSPARLQVKDGQFWTLQWSELRALALLLPSRKGKEK